MTPAAPSGVLVVDKPPGPTSFDVVRRVQRALGAAKAGHTGTLDPMATGVLPVCVGEATRVAQYLTEGDKAYEARVRLGSATDTLDAEGAVTATAPVPPLDAATVEAALRTFRGSSLQTPPMYSAVKVAGKRLYELARQGEEVERAARPVTVHLLELLDLGADELLLRVECSKGFFVRTLAESLARALGTVGHLQALRRTRSGPFTLAQAVPLAAVEQDPQGALARLVSEAEALAGFPALEVGPEDAQKVRHGGAVESSAGPGLWRVLGPGGELLALAEVVSGRLKYRRVLARRLA